MRVWGLANYLSHGNFSYRRLSISSEVIHFVGSFKSASAVLIRAMASSSENGPKLGYLFSSILFDFCCKCTAFFADHQILRRKIEKNLQHSDISFIFAEEIRNRVEPRCAERWHGCSNAEMMSNSTLPLGFFHVSRDWTKPPSRIEGQI